MPRNGSTRQSVADPERSRSASCGAGDKRNGISGFRRLLGQLAVRLQDHLDRFSQIRARFAERSGLCVCAWQLFDECGVAFRKLSEDCRQLDLHCGIGSGGVAFREIGEHVPQRSKVHRLFSRLLQPSEVCSIFGAFGFNLAASSTNWPTLRTFCSKGCWASLRRISESTVLISYAGISRTLPSFQMIIGKPRCRSSARFLFVARRCDCEATRAHSGICFSRIGQSVA